jgi:hypothetical protein
MMDRTGANTHRRTGMNIKYLFSVIVKHRVGLFGWMVVIISTKSCQPKKN